MISIGLFEKFTTELLQASTPSASGRPPHEPYRNSMNTNGLPVGVVAADS